jgi:hypothetical protein
MIPEKPVRISDGNRFSGEDHAQTTTANRERPMRAVIAVLLIALLSSPGFGQRMLDSKKKESEQSGPPRKSAEDKDYKSAVDRIPDQKFDPWRNMR